MELLWLYYNQIAERSLSRGRTKELTSFFGFTSLSKSNCLQSSPRVNNDRNSVGLLTCALPGFLLRSAFDFAR